LRHRYKEYITVINKCPLTKCDNTRYRRPKLAEAQLSFPVNLIHNVPFPIL